MATPPLPPNNPAPEPGLRQQYRQPEGAIPIERLKRFGIVVGVGLLGYFTIWGSCHRQPTTADKKKAAVTVWPMNPENIDSQENELQREMDEARRAAEQAELAKKRAQAVMDEGPHTAEADPVAQLRKQLRLEDLKRAHTAPYASAVAFAPPGHENTKRGADQEASQAPAQAPTSSVPQPGQQPPGASQQSQNASSEAPSGTSEPSPAASAQYRLDEGTIFETVLLNRLDGEFVGPVITQVSSDMYSRSGLELLIPKGSRMLGEARDVNSFDHRRLAVVFHRLILPNGKSVSLDKFRGLDQIGETGVVSKVDHHYLEIFGTSLALGGIGGLMQIGAYGGYGYDPETGFRVGFTERMGSSAEQVLAKFLNKFPTIKVLEGTRIKVILTNDLNLEAYDATAK